jgi:hypothetical protein
MNSVRNNLSKWIKEPSTWFSLVAFLTSLITFYFNWPRAASLQVYLDKVSILFHGSSDPGKVAVDLALPIYIINTGSPGNIAIVKNATAQIRFLPGNGSDEDLDFFWYNTARLLSPSEYKSKYPDRQLENAQDYFDYESRDIPFAIQGKETAIKIFGFKSKQSITNLTPPVVFEVSVTLMTMDGKIYRLEGLRYYLSADDFNSINQGISPWIIRQ